MRTETHSLLKELERWEDNAAARHFADFIRLSGDKDEAAEEVRQLMIETASNAVALARDMGLVAHDAFYPEESKQVINAARRMCNHIEMENGTVTSWITLQDGERVAYNTVEALKLAVVEYEENVLELEEDEADAGQADRGVQG